MLNDGGAPRRAGELLGRSREVVSLPRHCCRRDRTLHSARQYKIAGRTVFLFFISLYIRLRGVDFTVFFSIDGLRLTNHAFRCSE